MDVRLTKRVDEAGNQLSNRLWTTVVILAGVSAAIASAATILSRLLG